MRGLRTKGNFIDDWLAHEKEMNIRGFMGDFELRQEYEEAKRKLLGFDEDIEVKSDKEKTMDSVYERLSKLVEEYIADKETLREAMKKTNQ